MALNRVTLSGNLVEDPTNRQTANKTPVSNLRLAVERNFIREGDTEPGTDYINVVAWRKLAEFVTKYLRKGSGVIVEGHLTVSKDGDTNRWKLDVEADHIYFMSGRGKTEAPETSEPTGAEGITDPFENEEPPQAAPPPKYGI